MFVGIEVQYSRLVWLKPATFKLPLYIFVMAKLPLLWRILLLGIWGTCLAFMLLQVVVPALYFQHLSSRNLVHTLAWGLSLLVYRGAYRAAKWERRFLRGVIGLQWAFLGLLLLVPVYGWFVLVGFFWTPWAGDERPRPLLRRGSCVVRYQSDGRFSTVDGGGTLVLVQPIGPWLEWVTSLSRTPGLDSTWTLLDPQGFDLLDHSGVQRAYSRFHNRWLDHELATDFTPDTTRYHLPLPAATHAGRGVLGYVRDGRTYTIQPAGTNPIGELLRPQLHWRGRFQLTADVGYDEELTLSLADFRGIGTYFLVRPPTTSNPHAIPAAQANYMSLHRLGRNAEDYQYLSLPAKPVVLTITQFDSVRRVVAGTFQGLVHLETNRAGAFPSDTLHLQQGRFDVCYP